MLRLLWSVVMLIMWWALPAHAQQDFLQPEQAFRLNVSKQADGQLRLNWDISQGYYLYRQQMKVEVDPVGSALKVEWPTGTRKTDETYGESEVYHDQVTALLTAPDTQALTIGWQGCADAGLCYPPQTRRVNLADVAAAQSASPDVAARCDNPTSSAEISASRFSACATMPGRGGCQRESDCVGRTRRRSGSGRPSVTPEPGLDAAGVLRAGLADDVHTLCIADGADSLQPDRG